MHTLTQPATAAGFADPADAARAAWRRRVARIGSDIQLAFAILWTVRGTLATGWPGRLPLGLPKVDATPGGWPLICHATSPAT